jgi:hypothetical protein
MVQGGYLTNNGAYTTSADHICNKHSIPCKSGDVISITSEESYTIRVLYYNESGYVSYEAKTGETVTFTVPNNVTYFNFRFDANITPQTVGKISLTVNGKHVVQIVEHGKNLFDVSKATNVTKISNNEIRMGAHVSPIYDYHFKEKTQYTFSAYVKNALDENSSTLGNLRIKIKYTDGTSVDALTNNTTTYKYLTFVSDVNKTISNIIGYFGGGGYLYIKDFQIEEGEATPYEPYTEKVATIFLDKPLREGDIFVKVYGVWNVERNTTEDILDGIDEYWEEGTNNFSVNRSKKRGGTHGVYCSHFKQGTSLDTVGTVKEGSGETNLYIYFSKGTFTTLAEWKEWLQSNPITVQYRLATPTLTPLDLESQKASNGLETFKDMTHVEVNSKIKPSGIEAEYGTSQVGAYTLKSMNDNDTDRVERAEMKARLEELAVALVSQ